MPTTEPAPIAEVELEPSIEQLEAELGITIDRDVATARNPIIQSTNPWRYAGQLSSFPNLDPSDPSTDLGSPTSQISCKLFSTTSSSSFLSELPLDDPSSSSPQNVLIFQYRGKLHAIEHACPHQGYPLSKAHLNDIEDFGVVLSAGITCPKHGWTFDLFTGEADTGRYKLNIWEVDVRRGNGEGVWVRRKERKKIG
jgi:nitrite reductase/ring-hydroxylating ferredoxin subunit